MPHGSCTDNCSYTADNSGSLWLPKVKLSPFGVVNVPSKYDGDSEHTTNVREDSVLECCINQGVCQGAPLAPCTRVQQDLCT
jgi:hypothetical protein